MKDRKYIHALEMLTEGCSADAVEHYPHLQREIQAHWRAHRRLVRSRSIVGMGIGRKEVAGNLTPDLAVRFYVRKKLPRSKCRISVPREIESPGLGSLRTDVIEVGDIRLHASRKTRLRPAHPGCSVGIGLVAGTLGCFVKKRSGGPARYVLSNSHVIARDGIANLSSAVFQPAKVDVPGRRPGSFAELTEVVPFEFSPTQNNNLVDAAIARVGKPNMTDNAIIGVGYPAGVASARRDMRVVKSGRTTDVTHGVISDVHFITNLSYEKDKFGSVGRVGFKDQILVSKFSQDGDSGSLVLNENNEAVGLLFAGSDQVSVCNKIQNVFDLLDVELA